MKKLYTGNISTCVEQTRNSSRSGCLIQKHLHMRGANFAENDSVAKRQETSPHAWSKLADGHEHLQLGGNISTCVEQTASSRRRPTRWKKHLHMRGANNPAKEDAGNRRETSPHAWSKHLTFAVERNIRGNISTCVEQTLSPGSHTCEERKHLHMRGANLRPNRLNCRASETSPHAWSKLIKPSVGYMQGGNISTCVEQTAT